MSYAYWPPRLDYSPPGMPYLAGVRGLGDYAADVRTYQSDLATWNAAKAKYDADVASYATTVSSIDASYGSAQAAYQRDKADWDTEYAAYLTATSAWKSQVSQIKSSNAQRALVRAQGYGIPTPFPAWFVNQGYCLTQAQVDAYAKQCTTVKGLGQMGYLRGLGSSDADCGWKGMPLCAFPPRPAIRARPIAPRPPKYPAKPTFTATQPTAPTQPSATTTPSDGGGWSTKTPGSGGKLSPSPFPGPATTPDAPAAADASGGMIRNGLLIVALGVGGYLVYRTIKKPKAAA